MKKPSSILLLLPITIAISIAIFCFAKPALADCGYWQAEDRQVLCPQGINVYCTTVEECSSEAAQELIQPGETFREQERIFNAEGWLEQKQAILETREPSLELTNIGLDLIEEGSALSGTISNTMAGLTLSALGPPNPTENMRTGAAGSMGKLIAGMVGTPAVNTPGYIADIMNNMGLATPAYAQDEGTGWNALNSILTIWKAFRNIAYLGFVIIFVVVGFMIMFRAQINPQTVVTIQAALPKIVFTLLLVTFSYAIASLMIDLIYVLIYLMVGVLGVFGVITEPATLIDELLSKNAFLFIWQLLGGRSPATSAAHAVGELVSNIVGGGLVVEWVSKAISEPLAYLIIAVAILISLFKLFFQLLMAYLGIIFSVIFAPITLLFNALPNSNSFSSWIKGLFANAIIFPIVALLFVLAGALTGSQSFYVASDVGFQGEGRALVLPFVGGGFDTGALQAIIGIGCIMIMPKIVEMVQKMLGLEGGFAGMAGAAMAGVAAPLQLYQSIQERQTAKDQLRVTRLQLREEGKKPSPLSKAWKISDMLRP